MSSSGLVSAAGAVWWCVVIASCLAVVTVGGEEYYGGNSLSSDVVDRVRNAFDKVLLEHNEIDKDAQNVNRRATDIRHKLHKAVYSNKVRQANEPYVHSGAEARTAIRSGAAMPDEPSVFSRAARTGDAAPSVFSRTARTGDAAPSVFSRTARTGDAAPSVFSRTAVSDEADAPSVFSRAARTGDAAPSVFSRTAGSDEADVPAVFSRTAVSDEADGPAVFSGEADSDKSLLRNGQSSKSGSGGSRTYVEQPPLHPRWKRLQIYIPRTMNVEDFLDSGLLRDMDYDLYHGMPTKAIYHVGAKTDDVTPSLLYLATKDQFLASARDAIDAGFKLETNVGQVCWDKSFTEYAGIECMPLYDLMKMGLEVESSPSFSRAARDARGVGDWTNSLHWRGWWQQSAWPSMS